MSKLSTITKAAEKFIINNSSSILTAIGLTGTVTTALMAGKASYKVGYLVKEHEIEYGEKPDIKKISKEVWKLYIPSTISGAITIASVLASSKIQSRRAAALTAAYSISEKALSDYKEKIVETIGEKKEKAVRDQIAQDKVMNNPPKQDIIINAGTVLCCELYSGRYFSCDIEKLRKAQNDINSKMLREMSATLSDFYYLIDLPNTSFSGTLGWDSDKLLDLHFTTIMTDDGKPCIAFDYNYIKPR